VPFAALLPGIMIGQAFNCSGFGAAEDGAFGTPGGDEGAFRTGFLVREERGAILHLARRSAGRDPVFGNATAVRCGDGWGMVAGLFGGVVAAVMGRVSREADSRA